ncbi:alpha/beta fold hydrolase [Winogradskyella sp. PG-2]|uniref:alpha/beta fold hydrolase n=1 Tax=Winogradskyella sp. PG-2 TaxID=754409 RepID=UPI0004588046|nr:alpha/beta hydrolase [Winogradskyella sp. PG-2]BAO77260.1 hydrolase, alpha/beta fold family [Winogradskyella sp. PG-2]
MKKTITLFVFILTTISVSSQSIYSKAYGNPNNEPIIYLHGGPGYNSIGFELATAKELSENGFFVIVYDRRGEGRSSDKNAKFTFQETFDDLDSIYTNFNLKDATLMGHSFGGVVGTLYAEKYPNKTKSLILVAAPISMQETFLTIIKKSKNIYEKNKDSTNLKYIKMLEKMDKKSLEYSSYSFGYAMQNGFYTPKAPSEEAITIYTKLKTSPTFVNDGATMTYEAPKGFWKNENYTSIDLTQNLKSILENKTRVFGLYGTEDGLYSEEQIMKLKKIIPLNNFKYIDNCSHNVFIDQQDQFISALTTWIK